MSKNIRVDEGEYNALLSLEKTLQEKGAIKWSIGIPAAEDDYEKNGPCDVPLKIGIEHENGEPVEIGACLEALAVMLKDHADFFRESGARKGALRLEQAKQLIVNVLYDQWEIRGKDLA